MVHIKYTYRNGKKYGPYYYENKRVNGRVMTTYLGSKKPSGRRRNEKLPLAFYVLGGLLLVLIGFLFYNSVDVVTLFSPVESSSLLLKEIYLGGDEIVGEFILNVGGRYISIDSEVIVKFGDEEKTFPLFDFVEALDYPEIEFELEVYPVG
ncbi:MAG: hypothetical protein ABIH92_04990 [Nanoarchaeota archaeon]